jgi:hypothetical protein
LKKDGRIVACAGYKRSKPYKGIMTLSQARRWLEIDERNKAFLVSNKTKWLCWNSPQSFLSFNLFMQTI